MRKAIKLTAVEQFIVNKVWTIRRTGHFLDWDEIKDTLKEGK